MESFAEIKKKYQSIGERLNLQIQTGKAEGLAPGSWYEVEFDGRINNPVVVAISNPGYVDVKRKEVELIDEIPRIDMIEPVEVIEDVEKDLVEEWFPPEIEEVTIPIDILDVDVDLDKVDLLEMPDDPPEIPDIDIDIPGTDILELSERDVNNMLEAEREDIDYGERIGYRYELDTKIGTVTIDILDWLEDSLGETTMFFLFTYGWALTRIHNAQQKKHIEHSIDEITDWILGTAGFHPSHMFDFDPIIDKTITVPIFDIEIGIYNVDIVDYLENWDETEEHLIGEYEGEYTTVPDVVVGIAYEHGYEIHPNSWFREREYGWVIIEDPDIEGIDSWNRYMIISKEKIEKNGLNILDIPVPIPDDIAMYDTTDRELAPIGSRTVFGSIRRLREDIKNAFRRDLIERYQSIIDDIFEHLFGEEGDLVLMAKRMDDVYKQQEEINEYIREVSSEFKVIIEKELELQWEHLREAQIKNFEKLDEQTKRELKVIQENANQYFDALMTQVDYVYDIFEKQIDEVEEFINDYLDMMYEMYGLENGQKLMSVQVRNVSSRSFEWYSQGDHTIHWIAIGQRV